MSITTRKKKLNFKELLQNDVDNQFTTGESWRNTKSEKKSHEFLGKKRHTTSSKEKSSKEKEQRNQLLKLQEKETQINKDEYKQILSSYSDEMKAIGIDTTEEKEETPSFISDMNSLYYNLFFYTKFENSKPYKMIDYIISNNQYLINRPVDKERYDQMKKAVYAKNKIGKDNNLSVVFKTLYEYFRTDFSQSILERLFIKINEKMQSFNINSNHNNNSSNQLKNDDTISISQQEKKDKFTYSNFLADRLKHKSNSSIIEYTNDKEFVKSLLYLNNKSNKHLNKKNKLEKKLLDAFKENSDSFSHLSDQLLNESEIQFTKKIIHSKRLHKFLNKKFAGVINCIEEMKECHMNERQFVKFIDIIFKNKEDECEKESKIFKGDTKTLWICIKFIFFLHMLTKKDKAMYFTDNNFWKTTMSFLESKREELSLSQMKVNKDNEALITSSKVGRGRKRDSLKKIKAKSGEKGMELLSERKEANEKDNDAVSHNSTSVKEQDVEIENNRNSTQEIKNAIVLKYENGEDVFTFIKEERKIKRRKAKDKEKEKEKDKEQEEDKEESRRKDNDQEELKEDDIEKKDKEKDNDKEMIIIDKDDKGIEVLTDKEITHEVKPKPKRKRKPKVKDQDKEKDNDKTDEIAKDKEEDIKEKDKESSTQEKIIKEKPKRKPRKKKEIISSSPKLKIFLDNIDLLHDNPDKNKKSPNHSPKALSSKTVSDDEFNTPIKIAHPIPIQQNSLHINLCLPIPYTPPSTSLPQQLTLINPKEESNENPSSIKIKIPNIKEGLFSISNPQPAPPIKRRTRTKPNKDGDTTKKPKGRPPKSKVIPINLEEIKPILISESEAKPSNDSIEQPIIQPVIPKENP